jgi:hypothetical protein
VTGAQLYRKSFKELEGKRVRTLRPMQNRLAEIPEGTVMVITGKHSGFTLQSAEPCACCGVKLFISRIHPSAVELLP